MHAAGLAQQLTPPSPPARLGTGAIVILPDPTPAKFGFDQPIGKVESAGEGAASATRAVLNTPDLVHPWLTAGAGVVQFAAAPFAAGYGAISSSRAKLSAEKLAESKNELREAMSALASQEHLHDLLLEKTNEIGRRLVVGQRKPGSSSAGGSVCALLEQRVEELRLEQVDRHDHFALRITARVRLSRAPEASLIYERVYTYHSEKALFIDWARWGGLKSVARTGFRDLADRIAKDIASCSAESPLLVGTGYSGGARLKSAGPSQFAPEPAQPAMVAMVRFGQSPFGDLAMTRGHRRPSRISGTLPLASHDLAEDALRLVRAVDYTDDGLSFEIESTTKGEFRLQAPLTKDEALLEARSDTEWKLDGLGNDRNFVVTAGAALASIPLGIKEQSVAMWQGVNNGRLARAKARLEEAINTARPQEALALQTARELSRHGGTQSPRTMAAPRGGLRTSATSMIGAPEELSHNSSLAEPSETVLEITVFSAGLSGQEGVNSPVGLNIEARARVLRLADGAEVYSVPVSYRGPKKRFCAWAAKDARAFQLELNSCYRQLGISIATKLRSEGFAPSTRSSVLAGN